MQCPRSLHSPLSPLAPSPSTYYMLVLTRRAAVSAVRETSRWGVSFRVWNGWVDSRSLPAALPLGMCVVCSLYTLSLFFFFACRASFPGEQW